MLGTPAFPMDNVSFDKSSSREKLLQKWKVGQRYLQSFWSIWSDQYLLALRERSQMSHRQPRVTGALDPKVNSVVLIQDSSHSRNTWKLGRIISLNSSSDSQIRSARLKTSSSKYVTRPLSLLYPIECPADSESVHEVVDEESSGKHSSESPSIRKTRLQRRAAQVARQRLQEMLTVVDESDSDVT